MSAIDTGTQNVQNAANAGQTAINQFDPKGFAQSWDQGANSLFGGQQKQQNDYVQQYKNSIAANPTATDLYNQGNDRFNVQGLQQNANNLNNAVLQAPQQTLDSARGFNYDANQVANQTNLTLGRLSPLAAAAQNNANTAQSNASNFVQAGLSQNATNLLPVQQQGTMLNDLWARQATNFTQENQSTLDALAQKMQAGATLSAAEMAQFSQLAQAEEQYNQAVDSARISGTAQQNVATINNQNQVLPQGSTYYNPISKTAYNPVMKVARP